MKLHSAVAAAVVLLGGCAGEKADRPGREPPPAEQTMYGEQVRQLERAREEAREMERRMDHLNRQLEEAGQ